MNTEELLYGTVTKVDINGGEILGDNGTTYSFKKKAIIDNIQLQEEDLVIMNPIVWKTRFPEVDKIVLISLAYEIPELTPDQWEVADKIMAANKHLETSQMGNTDIKDGKGYDNSRYVYGFKLQQMWEDSNCLRFRPLIVRAAAALLARHIKKQIGPNGNHPMGITYNVLGLIHSSIEDWTEERIKSVIRRGLFASQNIVKDVSFDFNEETEILVVRSLDQDFLKNLAIYCAMDITSGLKKSVPQLVLPKGEAYKLCEFIDNNQNLLDKLPDGHLKTLNLLRSKYELEYATASLTI